MTSRWNTLERELEQTRKHLAGALRESYRLATREAKALGDQLQKINQRIRAEEKRLLSATQAFAKRRTEAARQRLDEARARIRDLQRQARQLEKEIRPIMRELGLAGEHLQKAVGIDRAIAQLQRQLGRRPPAHAPSTTARPARTAKKTTARKAGARKATAKKAARTTGRRTGNGKAAPAAKTKASAGTRRKTKTAAAKPAPKALAKRSEPLPPAKL